MQALGEFILTDPDMKIPARGKIFSVNEGYAQYWDESVTKYVEKCKKPEVSCDIVSQKEGDMVRLNVNAV